MLTRLFKRLFKRVLKPTSKSAKPASKLSRLQLVGLGLIALLGTSHPPAVPGIHVPQPSTVACEVKPSMLWLQPQMPGGPPQQTVHVQMAVAEEDRKAVPDTSFITASVNGTLARVEQAEWITIGQMSLLVVVPQVPQSAARPVPYGVQIRIGSSRCRQAVTVPPMAQWRVYVPTCDDPKIAGVDTEQLFQSLLPLAKLGRRSAALNDDLIATWGMASLFAHAGLRGVTREPAQALPGQAAHPSANFDAEHPALFWWEGPDGARVIVNARAGREVLPARAAPEMPDAFARQMVQAAERYAALRQANQYSTDAFLMDCGVKDAGRPTLSAAEIADWNRRFAYPHLAGDQDAFFADVATHDGDRLPVVRGGFDTQWNAAWVEDVAQTQRMRADAVRATTAQTWAALAPALAAVDPNAPSAMPSSATPSSIDPLTMLASHINTGPASSGAVTDTVEGDPYLVVFNSLAWSRSAPVTVTLKEDVPRYLTDMSTGNTIYSQRIAPNTLLFVASDVPALGYKVFRLEGPQPDVAMLPANAFATMDDASGSPILGSARFTLTVDSTTGGVKIFDALLSRDWMRGTLDAKPLLGNQLLYTIDGALQQPTRVSARVLTTGPVAAQLQVTGQFTQGRITQFTQTATLLNGVPEVRFENVVNQVADPGACTATGCRVERLYVAFPIDAATSLTSPTTPTVPPTLTMHVDNIGGIINLDTDVLPQVRRDDYAVQSFANVSAGELGATVAMPDVPFVEFGGLRTQQGFRTQPSSGTVFALAYAAPVSPTLPTWPTTTAADELRWRFGWMPRALAFDPVESVEFGAAQQVPLQTRRVPAQQAGVLPGTSRGYSLVISGTNAVVVSALKPAEDGDGLVLRLWNPARLSQTVLLDVGVLGMQQIQFADGVERAIGDAEPALNTRPFEIAAGGFLTLRLRRQALAAATPTAPESVSPLPTPTYIATADPASVGASETPPESTPSAALVSPLATESAEAGALPALPTTAPTLAPSPTPNDAPIAPPSVQPSASLPASPNPSTVAPSPSGALTTVVTTSVEPPAGPPAVAAASPTVVTVNAGNTPTVIATPQNAAPVAPPAATAASIPTLAAAISGTATAAAPAGGLATVAPPATAAPQPTATATTPPVPPTPVRGLPILDAFDRADAGVGANWTGNTSRFAIRANQLVSGTSGSDNNNVMYWTAMLSGTQEVSVRLVNIGFDEESANANNSAVRLMLKWQGTVNNGLTCFAVRVTYDVSDGRVRVEYCESIASRWQEARGSGIPQTFAPGDTFGARIDMNGVVQIFKNGAQIGSVDVRAWEPYALESTSGRVGLWYEDLPGLVLDDFSAQSQ